MKYTTLVLSLMFALMATTVNAQLKVTNSTNSLNADGYIGLLNGTLTNTDLNYNWFASARIAARVRWNMNDKFYVQSIGVLDISKWDEFGLSGFGNAFFNYSPTSWFSLQAGAMPTSLTYNFRPYPASNLGQFEYTSQTIIPGAGMGVKAIFNFNKLQIEANIVKRDSLNEYQAMFGFGKDSPLKVGGFYQEGKRGIVSEYKSDQLYLMVLDFVTNTNYGQQNTFAGAVSWEWSDDLYLMLDYQLVDWKPKVIEFGIGHSADFGNLKGFFAITLLHEDGEPLQNRLAFMLTL